MTRCPECRYGDMKRRRSKRQAEIARLLLETGDIIGAAESTAGFDDTPVMRCDTCGHEEKAR